jgi:hydroxymethylpyrimidine pyrophosphatase-like HAD family hydrolase
MLVALCTGRGLKESRTAIHALDHTGPLVLANGALISDPATGRTLHRATLEPHIALAIIDQLMNGDDAVLILLDPEVSTHDYLVVHPERLTANTRWWFNHVGATYTGTDRVTEADVHHALRVGIVGPASHMPPVRDRLVGRFGKRLLVQHFMAVAGEASGGEPVHVLEVFAAGVHKWSGLAWLAREHGIDPDEVAAIGDHINDVTMVQNAGCGIAMANAVPEVLAVAARRTASNDQAGVAAAIDRLIDGTW